MLVKHSCAVVQKWNFTRQRLSETTEAICFPWNHKNLLDQMRKQWGENWARTHQCLAQKPSSPEFCSSLLPAMQPRLIHSQCSAKTMLIYCNCYFIAILPGMGWNQWSAQLPTPSFIPAPAFLWCSGESLADEQLSGPATQNKAFQLLYILTCRTESWGVNKPHFPFVLPIKHSISHRITNMIKGPYNNKDTALIPDWTYKRLVTSGKR